MHHHRARHPVLSAILVVALALAGTLGIVAAPVVAPAASAADASQWDPGNIISDAVFYDGGAMSADAIQAFLQSIVAVCRSTYACLDTYIQNTPNMPAVSGRCSAYSGASPESAASIIAKVGAACGVSQKVLLVLLEKEQSLVSSSSPTQSRFDRATGFACPDTAPCDPNVAGFFYQVYYAAKQFRTYQMNPGAFNYHAGVVNNILYSPNHCGTSPVYIANAATAGLYDYTPYQPNAAALASLYGTGDACSSYGNRNFWRIFTDWFGSPTVGSSLVRSASGVNIYLVSGSTKYLIQDSVMLSSFSNQGGVAVISDSSLASYTTSHAATRIIRSTSGGIYLEDAGIKLLFPTCDLVVDYGGSCDPGGYTQLTDWQVQQFVTGPTLTNVLRTNTGGAYKISGGKRFEIADGASATAAGLALGGNILTENAVSYLPVGSPILHDDSIVTSRDGGAGGLWSKGQWHPMTTRVLDQTGFGSRQTGSLLQASIALLPVGAPFTGALNDGTTTYVTGPAGRYSWASSLSALGLSVTAVNSATTIVLPLAGSIDVGSFVKGVSGTTVFYVLASGLAPINTWNDYLALSRNGTTPIISLADDELTPLATVSAMLTPGKLVVAPSSQAVYLIDGPSTKEFLSSFDIAAAAGITHYTSVPDASLARYATSSASLGYTYSCSGSISFAAGGSLHAIGSSLSGAYGVTAPTFDGSTCAALAVGVPATAFIRAPTGAIYEMDGGTRRPVTSMARYTQLGGTSTGYIDVDSGFLTQFPVGPAA